MNIKEVPHGICYPFGQETALAWTAWLDFQDSQKNDCWSCLKKVRQSFRVPVSWKNLPDTLKDTEESNWQTANIRWNCLWNFLIHGKVCWILWACRLNMDVCRALLYRPIILHCIMARISGHSLHLPHRRRSPSLFETNWSHPKQMVRIC